MPGYCASLGEAESRFWVRDDFILLYTAVIIPYEMTILNRNRTRSFCSTLLVLLIDLLQIE